MFGLFKRKHDQGETYDKLLQFEYLQVLEILSTQFGFQKHECDQIEIGFFVASMTISVYRPSSEPEYYKTMIMPALVRFYRNMYQACTPEVTFKEYMDLGRKRNDEYSELLGDCLAKEKGETKHTIALARHLAVCVQKHNDFNVDSNIQVTMASPSILEWYLGYLKLRRETLSL